MPDTMSASCADAAIRRDVLQQQPGLAVDQEDLLDAIEQRVEQHDFGERLAGAPRVEPPLERRHDRLCSSVRLSDSSIPLSLAAMALRIAGPMTGNSASASGCGSRRTDAVIASSTVGASARASCGSSVRSCNGLAAARG